MLIIYPGLNNLIFPKVDRCKIDPRCMYQLMMQNQATKEILMFTVYDRSQGHPFVFEFDICPAEDMAFGEYKVYLLSNNRWESDQVDTSSPESLHCKTQKGAITVNDKYLVFNGKILVTPYFNALLCDAKGAVISECRPIVTKGKSTDMSMEGKIVKCVDIIHTDILKYYDDNLNATDRYVEPHSSYARKNYIEYDRY